MGRPQDLTGHGFARRRMLAAAGAAVLQAALPASAHVAAPAPITGFELPEPLALKPFSLVDHRGRPFARDRLEGRWTLLLFGFVRCTDVCPTTMVQMAEVRRGLPSAPAAPASASVFVTIDPAHDSREDLARYVARFDDEAIGVTGSPAAIDALARQFRVRYAPAKGGARYQFDHTASVSLLGPDARLYAVFTLPLRPERVAGDIGRMNAQYLAACSAAAPDPAGPCPRRA